MIPAKGGDPTPPPPMVLGHRQGVDYCTRVAQDYLRELEAYRDSESPHRGMGNMSPSQRQHFKALLGVWTRRSLGMDPQYLKFGTFPRHPESRTYPDYTDLVMEQRRRAHPGANREARDRRDQENSLRNHTRSYVQGLRKKAAAFAVPKPGLKVSAMTKAAMSVQNQEKKGETSSKD